MTATWLERWGRLPGEGRAKGHSEIAMKQVQCGAGDSGGGERCAGAWCNSGLVRSAVWPKRGCAWGPVG